MTVTSGVVIDGKIVVGGEPLPEGTRVSVCVADGTEPYHLTATEADELNKAIDQVETGDVVDGDEHLAHLRS